MAMGAKDHNLHSHPYLMLVSSGDENGRRGPCNPSSLSYTVNKAGERGAPCKQSALPSISMKLVWKKVKYFNPQKARQLGAENKWSNRDCVDLLQEISSFELSSIWKGARLCGA